MAETNTAGPGTGLGTRSVRAGRHRPAALCAESYARLLDALTARGRLPEPAAAHARIRLDRDTARS
ncbi:hypothetical protein [Streptomyces sp. NPDC050287]|uniref:hypothetical protein n=1 Tax=Streptomyces sp. NPDC050287 TaxID=3365608 RepID=UPI00379FB222